jgi:glycosyltransferase involved in cell wall biosynthesis
MFCSTIIPTIGRPTLSRSVNSVLDQQFDRDNFEVIVVNDSGQPLPDAKWQKSERVQVINTERRERSVARNTGAAIARGRYLHFLDDDDWLLPGTLTMFWELAQNNKALLLYGGYNFVDAIGNILESWYPDEEGNCLIRLIAGEWLPLQASLILSDAFFATPGFEAWMIPYQDNDLLMQIAMQGNFSVAKILVASIVRSEKDSTTDYSKLRDNMRWSREKLLNTSSDFARMRDSAKSRTINSSYWQGRITAAYLTSMLWNLQHNRLFTGLSRSNYALANLFLSGYRVFSLKFWRGVFKPHITRGFLNSHGIK